MARAKSEKPALAGDAAETGKPPVTVIVRGPAKGRWRIGLHFGAAPVAIPADDLTEDDYGALLGDPELTVTLVDAPT